MTMVQYYKAEISFSYPIWQTLPRIWLCYMLSLELTLPPLISATRPKYDFVKGFRYCTEDMVYTEYFAIHKSVRHSASAMCYNSMHHKRSTQIC